MTETETLPFVLEAPRDQDLLKDNISTPLASSLTLGNIADSDGNFQMASIEHEHNERSSWSQNCRRDAAGTVEDSDVDKDESLTLNAETREAVAAVKFIASHLKQEDDFAEVNFVHLNDCFTNLKCMCQIGLSSQERVTTWHFNDDRSLCPHWRQLTCIVGPIATDNPVAWCVSQRVCY